MWIIPFLITVLWFSMSQARGIVEIKSTQKPAVPLNCDSVLDHCRKSNGSWTRCYEEHIITCVRGRFIMPNFKHMTVNSSQEANVDPTNQHLIRIPSSALQKSRGAASTDDVVVVASVINSTYFKLSPPSKTRLKLLHHREGIVFRGQVLAVKAGSNPVSDLSEPIKLIFNHNKEVENGTCVFWQESVMRDGTGYWSAEGCETRNSEREVECSCSHLSFFAVLVNPDISVTKADAVRLSYITYIGSGLSVIFTFISLIIYICLNKRRPEKATSLHIQLTGAMLCLHLSFLLCCFWVWMLKENEESSVCRVLGFVLHWSFLATLTWAALEGFHVYLLLIRVFNIYVRRYVLKLSLIGWGLPTLVTTICGISGVYGKYTLSLRDGETANAKAHICWMSSNFTHSKEVSYVTTVAFPLLVILYNSCMLGLVVFKMWGLRKGGEGFSSCSNWNKKSKDKAVRLWKDCATVLGLSCVLGLPWALATTTYVSLSGIYVFTIFNSLQGVFMFLWSLALTCKSQSDNNSSIRDTSSQKTMTTSFNN